MTKRIALYDTVTIDGVTFNAGEIKSVDVQSDDAQIDVSGFNASGTDEFLAGSRARSITMDVFMKRGAGETRQVLYPLHRDKSIFNLTWRSDQNSAASATNPEWRGLVTLPSWGEGANRGDVEVRTLVFVSQGIGGLEAYET